MEVKPICLTITPDSNSTTLQFNEKSTLAGYITIINFNMVTADTITVSNRANTDAKFLIPEGAKNGNIWRHFNKRFGTNYLASQKSMSIYNHDCLDDKEDQDYVVGDVADLNMYDANRILTKRLWRGKLIDLAEKRYEIENNEERVKTEEEFDPKDTVFKETLDPSKNSKSQTKVIFRKNLLEKITDKEKGNAKIKLFYIFSIIWLGLAVAFNSLVLSESYKFTQHILTQLNAGRNASHLLTLTGSVMTYIYEIELVLSNKNMKNSTAEAKDKFVRNNFANIDSVINQIIERSNILSEYLSEKAMENVFDYSYDLAIAGQYSGLLTAPENQTVSGLLAEFEAMNVKVSSQLQQKLTSLINEDSSPVDQETTLPAEYDDSWNLASPGSNMQGIEFPASDDIFSKMSTARKLESRENEEPVFDLRNTKADVAKFAGAPNFDYDVSVS